MSVFNGQPGLLGAACVAVCWGIPQTLGMGILAKKEEKGREILREWGVEEADVEKGNWGADSGADQGGGDPARGRAAEDLKGRFTRGRLP